MAGNVTYLRAQLATAEREQRANLAAEEAHATRKAIRRFRMQTDCARLHGYVFQNGRGFVKQVDVRPMQGCDHITGKVFP